MSVRGRWIAAAVACAPLLAADWPGRDRELAAQIEDAPAPRRAEILVQIAATGSAGAGTAVVHALDDPDPAVRMTAAGLVARFHYAAARPVLITWLADPLPEVRAAGARGLGALGDPTSMAALVRMLGDADVAVRLAAVEAISSVGGADATVPLLDRLADPESAVRVRTARALGSLGDPRAVLSLLGALQDTMPEVREATATALGRLRDPRAVRGLLGLLRDPQSDVRLAATRALGTLGAPEAVIDLAPLVAVAERAGDAGRQQLARAAVEAIGRIGGHDAVQVLVRAIRRPEAPAELVRAAGDALRALGPDVRGAVPDLVADPIPVDAREPIVRLLGDVGGEAAAQALIVLLASPDPDFAGRRTSLLTALGRTGTPAALRVLLVAAGPDETPGASSQVRETRREGALEGLRAYAGHHHGIDPEAVDPLIAALQRPITGATPDAGRGFVSLVASMLGASHNPRAGDVLTHLLSAREATTRATAAQALGSLDVPDGVDVPGAEALAAALGDPDGAVRLAAAETLGQRGARRALEALLAAWSGPRPIDRGHAARAMGRIGARLGDARVAPVLVQALHGSRADTVEALLDGLSWLARTGDARAIAALLDAAGSETPLAAEQALSNALGEAAGAARARLLAALRAQLGSREPETRATAAWALGHAPGSDLTTLTGLLTDAAPAVATNAAGALARWFASGVAPDESARTAVCAAFAARHAPLLRANLLRAAASGGFVCDAETQRRLTLDARAPVLRAAAAESLLAAAAAAPDRRRVLRAAIDQCARVDGDAATAAVCRDTLARTDARASGSPGSTRPTADGPPQDTIDALVIGTDEASALARAPVALVMSDGVVRVAWTGLGGWVHERPAPTGTFYILDPDTMPPEP